MTVLSVAYPFAPVDDQAVGGAEYILDVLDRALMNAGHRSLVVAQEGSRPQGVLFPTPEPSGILDDEKRRWCRKSFQAAIDRALSSASVDLIHMHGFDFHEYRLPGSVPILVTLHMPIAWYPREFWKRYGSNVQFQCVSESQRNCCLADMRNVQVIPNGVPLPQALPASKDKFAIVLGRVCPEKNMHVALEAGTLAGTPVLLGGRVFPYEAHLNYFREKIAPRLHPNGTSVQHSFLGPVSGLRKEQLLGRAKCLLHATVAPETSSLVAMEALASGTPVIAFSSGALPEIVSDGETGFLVNNTIEMAAAIKRIHTIQPETCRSVARSRFSQDRMIRDYFELYKNLASQPHVTCEDTPERDVVQFAPAGQLSTSRSAH
jgi:glycosyltransferase involved in cell wall biosynthesis